MAAALDAPPLQCYECSHSGHDNSVTAALAVSIPAGPFGPLDMPQHLLASGSLSGAESGECPLTSAALGSGSWMVEF